ncbi:MAG TPA: tripartite tricarboxylate transporter substrate binding protein [Casimicrobiaceae bacterium]|nr:tripartite tricarboxylate transporter substrate binding protein [Casimicrobiaceae bacterium]
MAADPDALGIPAGMMVTRRQVLAVIATAPLSIARSSGAAGDAAYPRGPVRFIVPLPAGGASDFLARLTGAKLGDALGQPVVVENRPGAAGRIAMDYAAKAAPDGQTIFLATNGTSSIGPNQPVRQATDLNRSFTPVTKLARLPIVIAVAPTLGIDTLRELLDRARRAPGTLAYASSGVGSTSHLAAQLLCMRANVTLVHVPYAGTAFAVKDVLSGDVPIIFSNMGTIAGHVRSGQLRALAVAGAQRVDALPGVPTVAESGFPGFDVTTWLGVLVPAGTPAPIVARLHDELVRIVRLPDVREQMASASMEPVGNAPAEFAAELDADGERWAKVIRESRIPVE